MTIFIPSNISSHAKHKCIFIWIPNCYLFCVAFSDTTTCTELECWEAHRSPFSTDGRPPWVTPSRNTPGTKSKNETGRLGYKVQTTHFHLLLLVSFNCLFKFLSYLSVMNTRLQPNAWDYNIKVYRLKKLSDQETGVCMLVCVCVCVYVLCVCSKTEQLVYFPLLYTFCNPPVW